ncbi:zinc ribbon domain-containing protein, partial [Microcoleus sp. herbarium12]|uniref:zinc ribbon domain-containing protein n=1 Tax=Microcoleus sp. herbarium12 TaxID=3055437 RepID=UPI002FD0EF7D
GCLLLVIGCLLLVIGCLLLVIGCLLKVFEKVTVAVNPAYTSQECSNCGIIVKKSLSTRTHICKCGCSFDRDENAARNILSRGLGTVGQTEISRFNLGNACGEAISSDAGEILQPFSKK